ncbi:hypothetical protein GCM10020001_024630 [Nonomuraea salmonea]
MTERKQSPSDLSDVQWALIEPVLTAWKAVHPSVSYELREIVNVIRYQGRTGVHWDYLPIADPSLVVLDSSRSAHFGLIRVTPAALGGLPDVGRDHPHGRATDQDEAAGVDPKASISAAGRSAAAGSVSWSWGRDVDAG